MDFSFELKRARAMLRAEPERNTYWTAYVQGIQRGYHGSKYGDPAQHRALLAIPVDAIDEGQRQRRQGYRDGLAAVLPPMSFMAMLGGSSTSAARRASARRAGEDRSLIKWTLLPDGRWRGERDGVSLESTRADMTERQAKASLRLRLRNRVK